MTQEAPSAGAPLTAVQALSIVSAAIHPAIGVARIGNSAVQIFLGPEVDEPAAEPPGAYRDGNSALKRQAARFRIYGYDSAGKVVAELTIAQAAITWSVHLANGKAGWYQFNLALDIAEASGPTPTASTLRNASVTGAARTGLVIDGGRQSVSGAFTVGPTFQGQVMGQSVTLGELATDDAGRLLVLGGKGVSASFNSSPVTHYANNDGWYDDTSDGPVTASVSIGGRTVPVDPAWVVVAPPNYAPNLKSVRTMYDMVRNVFVENGTLPAPLTSFTQDILPIFQRMSALQWTNFGFFRAFGHGAPMDLASAAFLAGAAPLLTAGDPAIESRRQLVNAFRVFDRDGPSPVPLPWIYGDAPSAAPPFTTHANTALSPTQMQALADWAASTYRADYNPAAQPPRTIDAVPLAEQPAMLDRAALSFCLADAFHPGCEITWPMRHASMYSAPFRIAHAPPGTTQPDYGPALTPAIALSAGGPLGPQWPGGLTRWMAVPWQTDTASCLSGYDAAYDPYLPTFWPARVPNQVLDLPSYRKVMDKALPHDRRVTAFETRRSWTGVLPGKTQDEKMAAMVVLFGAMGIAEQRPGPAGDPAFPETMQVAQLPNFLEGEAAAAAPEALQRAPHHHAPSADGTYMGRFPGGTRRPPGDR